MENKEWLEAVKLLKNPEIISFIKRKKSYWCRNKRGTFGKEVPQEIIIQWISEKIISQIVVGLHKQPIEELCKLREKYHEKISVKD